MQLYGPTHVDRPYTPSDLEWLYRMHEDTKNALSSRLSLLAPVSFYKVDGQDRDSLTRRRMFSTDS